jgi:hypothetical protein
VVVEDPGLCCLQAVLGLDGVKVLLFSKEEETGHQILMYGCAYVALLS